MKKHIARLLVFTLIVTLFPTIFFQKEARAAEQESLLQLRPEADKFVDNIEGYPDGDPEGGGAQGNFLYIGYDPGFGDQKGAMRYNFGSIPQHAKITKAVLNMNILGTSGASTFVNVFGSEDINWLEDRTLNLPWKNSPVFMNYPISKVGRQSIDVTQYVKSKLGEGRDKVTFVLEGNDNSQLSKYFWIKDSKVNDPNVNTYLEISYNVNTPPTDIALSSSSIQENSPIGTTIGTLSATDADAGETFTYSLGGVDAAAFTISGNALKTNTPLDYKTKNAYSISIQATDSAGNTLVKPFTINVTKVYNPPVVTGVVDGGIYNHNVTVTFDSGTATAVLNGSPFTSGSTLSGEGHYTLIATSDGGDTTTIQFTVDKTAPTATIMINGGAAFTNNTSVTLSLTVSDLTSVDMAFSNDGVTWSAREPFSANKAWVLTSGDGDKTVYVKLIDAAGHETIETDSIILDQIKPTGSIQINNGASHTSSRQVLLSLFASDGHQMEFRLSNEDGNWTAWSSQIPLPEWTLTNGDGLKIVTMEVRDQAGNVGSFSKSITLSTTGPIVTGVTDSSIYNSDVTITFNKGSAKLNGADFTSGTTVSQEGRYNLIVTDTSGLSTTVHFTIDKTPPSGSFTINSGAATTSSTRVTLTITGTDTQSQIEMRMANENEAWSSWQPYTPSTAWTLPTGNGTKKVLLELRDEANNVTALQESIELRVYNPPSPTPPTTIPVKDVSLDESSFTLAMGETKRLKATVFPENATNQSLTWSSSDPRVASVDEEGEVTANRAGEAEITATTKDGQKTASSTVSVTKEEEADGMLEASESALWLRPGITTTISIYKKDGSKRRNITKDPDVSYSTDNSLVTVQNGRIKSGKKEGEDFITVSYQGEELTIPVTISKKTIRSILVTPGDKAVLEDGEYRQLHLIATLSDKGSQDITELANWSSSNLDVVEVTAEGEIIAGKPGKAIVTAEYGYKKVTVRILVVKDKEKFEKIKIAPSSLNLKENDSTMLDVYAVYERVYDERINEVVEWEVADPEIATVEDGKVTAHKKGKTTISVSYGGKTSKITVNVRGY
ncbi:Ig-like domain-containing protein [Brevibacillus choshinensis]|uniref:Ig-like domain-containing protein n=1 Tax=Brevibacillus choshinensis TaxID=54911 RepID=UPI0006EBFAD2|nr:Ig-like domain-containing protein [Brevibacillus choshinensis]